MIIFTVLSFVVLLSCSCRFGKFSRIGITPAMGSKINLPSWPSQTASNNNAHPQEVNSYPQNVDNDGKRPQEVLSNSSSKLADTPIAYHYLTFDTELPPPTDSGLTKDGSAAPEPPDLRNYVSPFTWSESRKTFTTWLSCAVTVLTAYTAGAYSKKSLASHVLILNSSRVS